VTIIALVALTAWLYLLIFHGGFWLARETDTAPVPAPERWPAVAAIVPARDEAAVIARSISSLLAQDYSGDLRVILVDDGSSDGTAELARKAGGERLEIISGSAPPAGWTGKLWALEQGVRHAGAAADFLWFSDADIAHAPDTLRSLVARAEAERLTLNSLMAKLECETPAERALIPAFVFFFQMLYPFGRVNDPRSKIAAAAGGCMLVRRDAFQRAGGQPRIAHAIIDDCATGRMMKEQGPIRLLLTERSVSVRPYGGWRDIGAMIARSAYAQLGYSPLLLAGTVAGMALLYLAPPLIGLFGRDAARWLGLGAWALMALAFQPMLAFYRRSPLWGMALPLIATFYTGATVASAWRHWQGKGGMWKGRAQAGLRA
jgi:hopene-associated glycosyltransferase HpnB